MKRLLLTTTFLVSGFMAAPVHADPISMAIAATAQAVFATGGIATFSFLGISGAAGVFASFAVRAGLGYALNALLPKPKVPSSAAGRGYTINSFGSALPHAIIYGTVRVGGAVFFAEATGTTNRYHHRCIAFAGHEIDSYSEIYLNDEICTFDGSGNILTPASYVGFVRVKEYLGTTTQAADTDLIADSAVWTSAHQAKGIAYLYVRFDYDATAFPNGLPILTAVVKGRKVYDPRDASTAWSDNSALCLRDYLTADFGINEAAAEIDEAGFSVAANVCDELVAGEKRFTCNGSLTLDSRPEDAVLGLLSSMGGMIWYAQGQWGCKAATYETPTDVFDEGNLRGNLNIATKNNRRDNFNSVRGVYFGAESSWQTTDYPLVSGAAFVTEDSGETITVDLPLLYTSTATMAQRIATIALKRNRQQLTVSAPFDMTAVNTRVGDTVKLTNSRFGWVEKTFEVIHWRFGLTGELDLQVNMTLREIDSSVFDGTLS